MSFAVKRIDRVPTTLDLTLGELLENYAQSKGLCAHSRGCYHSLLKRRLRWLHMPVTAITLSLLNEKRGELVSEGRLLNRREQWADSAIDLVRTLLVFAGDHQFYKAASRGDVMQSSAIVKNSFAEILVRYCREKSVNPATELSYQSRLNRTGWKNFPVHAVTVDALRDQIEFLHNLTVDSGRSQIWCYQASKMLYCLLDFAYEKGISKISSARQHPSAELADTELQKKFPPKIQRIERSLATTGNTFGAIAEAYIEYHAKLHCRSWRKIADYLRLYLTDWRYRIAANISRMDVQEKFQEIGAKHGKTAANRTIQVVRTIYNRAFEWDLVEGDNPASGMKLFRLKSRERFLEISEIDRLFEALLTLRYSTTRDFLAMCLFTGARRANVAAMRWDQISFERKIWTIPLTKNGSSQNVPLTSVAFDVLKARHENATSEWVFPSARSKAGHLTKPENAWTVLKERAGLKDIRIHDLRRSMASWEAMTGANISVIAATLNHKDLKSVQIYARLQIEPVRDAMEIATTKMLSGFNS